MAYQQGDTPTPRQRRPQPTASPMPQRGGKPVAVTGPGLQTKMPVKPKTGGGLQSPPNPRANPMPGQGGARPGFDPRSRINDLPGLSPMDKERLVRAANRGAGALRDAAMGQPFEQDVMQAFAGDQGAKQNPLGGSRPASDSVPAMQPPPPGTVNLTGAPVLPGGSAGAPVPLPPPQPDPLAAPPGGAVPGTGQRPAGPPSAQDWDAVNKQLAGVDPATVAQWRQQMQAMPQGTGERFAFIQKMLSGYQPGNTGQRPPITQTPPINPLPPGGSTQTPPIYVPPSVPPQTEPPVQVPDIFLPF